MGLTGKRWSIQFDHAAEKELDKLDPEIRRRILSFLFKRLAEADNPRQLGEALHGERFGELWKYRVGDFRIICKIVDERLVVIAVRIGHRREVYR